MREAGYRDRWIKHLGTYLARDPDRPEGGSSGPKEFLGALASWAGKGRDELLQVICREIGQATAMVVKEPLTDLLRHKKLQITIELIPFEESKANPEKPPAAEAEKPKRTTYSARETSPPRED